MLYVKKVEEQTMQIVELLAPALEKRRGRYKTAWGIKTNKGLKASIFNILVDKDLKYEKG
jgi:hypothetical protein